MRSILGMVVLAMASVGCRSLEKEEAGLHAFPQTEPSFGEKGRQDIGAALRELREALTLAQAEEGFATGHRPALERWLESLALYMHLFPRAGDGGDLYVELRERSEFGLAFTKAEDAEGQRQWMRDMLRLLGEERITEYLARLNASYAGRRETGRCSAPYWLDVNFIPDLRASFSHNFDEYIAALRLSLLSLESRADAEEPAAPGQGPLIERAEARIGALLGLSERYETKAIDAARRQTLQEKREYYRKVLERMDEGRGFAEGSLEAMRIAQSLKVLWEEQRTRP